jgi:hypothetical protein
MLKLPTKVLAIRKPGKLKVRDWEATLILVETCREILSSYKALQRTKLAAPSTQSGTFETVDTITRPHHNTRSCTPLAAIRHPSEKKGWQPLLALGKRPSKEIRQRCVLAAEKDMVK